MFQTYRENVKTALDTIECTYHSEKVAVETGVSKVIKRIEKLRNEGKTMFWIGNGGSAAIAVHSTLDYFRTGNIKTQAFYDGPMMTCLGNDFGYLSVFEKPISLFATPEDVLVAISSSGRSQNILNAVDTGKKRGCYVITLSGFVPDNPLRMMGDINFYVSSNHYGVVELTHSVLCHSFLDLYMAGQNGGDNVG